MGKSKTKVTDLSGIKLEGFCSFLREMHFGTGKWENREAWIYFTHQSSFKDFHKEEKNLHDWLSDGEVRY